jgi:hypothetical protein
VREICMLRSTRRGLETWHGRDGVTLADERARQRGTQTSTYTGASVLDPTDERGWETGRCRMAQVTAPILDSTSGKICAAADWRPNGYIVLGNEEHFADVASILDEVMRLRVELEARGHLWLEDTLCRKLH